MIVVVSARGDGAESTLYRLSVDLRGDEDTLRAIDDAENLLKDLKKTLKS